MHVAADLNWFLQLIVFAFAAAFGLIYLFRNTASRYFVDSSFDPSAADHSSLDSRKRDNMPAETLNSCAVCGLLSTKQCGRCKMVRYCSESCQTSHWKSEHKNKCLDMQSSFKSNHRGPALALAGKKASVFSVDGSSKCLKQSNKILFPYEEFAKYFSWDNPGYPPCGLLNCGNSCFANVVLQCLTYTRPLVAYLLEKGHRIECQREDWCFLCEFQKHLEKACRSLKPFSPVNILSRLPNIGGNLGCGEQEDAHELMRFAIDTMQSACLDEFGGEKYVHPSYRETTLIQHIFGGRLQSQVICAECNNVSNQFENMMDLTVEIHGDAESLEECLDQFTAKERLHGDNMYKCDGCNDYVMAWKRLTIQRPPNILTIALKRFQSGRFGKLNKRVTFPETLDLRPYISESEDGNDIYRLYAVIVHLDMMNASFFGHYICYIKDLCGNWYRMDDCEVVSVDLEEVLSQGVYMLLYSRIRARPSCLLPPELLKREELPSLKINEMRVDSSVDSGQSLSATNSPVSKVESELSEEELLSLIEDEGGDAKMECCSNSVSPISKDIQISGNISETSPSSSINADEVNGSENDLSDISNLKTEKSEVGPPNSASTPENIGQKNCLPYSDANGNRSFVKNPEQGKEELLSLITDEEDEGDDVKMECCSSSTLSEGIRNTGSKSISSPSSSANADVVNESENGFLNETMLKTENRSIACDVAEKAIENNGNANANQSIVKNSESGSPVVKLKPLFARGFLEKTPQKELIRPNEDNGM